MTADTLAKTAETRAVAAEQAWRLAENRTRLSSVFESTDAT